jgi:hypothetical protein
LISEAAEKWFFFLYVAFNQDSFIPVAGEETALVYPAGIVGPQSSVSLESVSCLRAPSQVMRYHLFHIVSDLLHLEWIVTLCFTVEKEKWGWGFRMLREEVAANAPETCGYSALHNKPESTRAGFLFAPICSIPKRDFSHRLSCKK